MYVTKLVPVTKAKYKVFLDDEFAFVLYKGELSRYELQEGKEVSEQAIDMIKKEVLEKRAKIRAMHILERADRTEEELRTKLRQDLYPEEIVEKAMSYVKSFGYIGDQDYACRYASSKARTKSKNEVKMLLKQKGIAQEYIEKALEYCYEEVDEREVIQRLVEKKHFNAETATEQEKKRIFDYLLRKGFRYEEVRQVIQVSSWNA
jgi:regulatory protein